MSTNRSQVGLRDEERPEIERKFLVPTPPTDLESHPSQEIQQGYIPSAPGHEIRVRKAAVQRKTIYFLTEKTGRGSLRGEREREIGRGEFRSLWRQTRGNRLSKRRYKIPYNYTDRQGCPVSRIVELDVYSFNRRRSVVAEVEFETTEQRDLFVPPVWFGPEVTGVEAYSNRSIARNGFPVTPPLHRALENPRHSPEGKPS